MKKALITGAAGFIGYHLTNFLSKNGWQVIAMDNLLHPCKAPLDVIYADIRYFQDIEPLVKKVAVVFHLAAQISVDKSVANPEETFDINVKGTINILEACRKYKKKLVFASSSEVYGTALQDKMDESHPLNPQSPYAASKAAADRICFSYFKTYGMDISILRNFNTFGPFQNDDSYGGVIAIFTRLALEGKPLKIFGDGRQERDYIWIDDALQGYKIAAECNLKGQPLNIGSGKTISINKLAKMIIKLTNSPSKIIHTKERPGEVRRLCADISFAKSLGFRPKTDFEKNLKEYINWFKGFR